MRRTILLYLLHAAIYLAKCYTHLPHDLKFDTPLSAYNFKHFLYLSSLVKQLNIRALLSTSEMCTKINCVRSSLVAAGYIL